VQVGPAVMQGVTGAVVRCGAVTEIKAASRIPGIISVYPCSRMLKS
jgi:hypothetical protein